MSDWGDKSIEEAGKIKAKRGLKEYLKKILMSDGTDAKNDDPFQAMRNSIQRSDIAFGRMLGMNMKLMDERSDLWNQLGNIIFCILGDGDHYEKGGGYTKATKAAIEAHYALVKELDHMKNSRSRYRSALLDMVFRCENPTRDIVLEAVAKAEGEKPLKELDELRAERDRYRTAMERIASQWAQPARDIALATLKETNEKKL